MTLDRRELASDSGATGRGSGSAACERDPPSALPPPGDADVAPAQHRNSPPRAAPSGAVRPLPDPPPRLLAEGKNCWRIARAKRLALLVDGDEYFPAVRSALAKAQRSIFILGWDIDSRMRLVPEGAHDGLPESLRDFLDALVAARRNLRAYVLSWDFAMLYALEREWLPLYEFDWKTHRRLSFRLDDRHPVGASHHQKVVVVDDSVAFVSGFDLTRCRWDTAAHEGHNPLRTDDNGKPYGPFHDVGAVVEGDCARALSELARRRWKRATGRAPRRRMGKFFADAWPDGVSATLEDVDVAIARTEPREDGHPGVAEIRTLHEDAIASAQRSIYAENQYFTSRAISATFAAALARPDGPELAVVSPVTQSGWLEASTMGVLRARIHRELESADAHDRYRLYCPVLPWLGPEDGCLNVHSKVLVIDDALLTLGSANLSDRSMYLDTECNLAIESAGDPRVREAIAGFRNRLLAEHLGTTTAEVASALARADGWLHAAIGALQVEGQRTLASAHPELDPMVDAVTPDHGVLDPEQPLDPDLIMDELVPAPEHREGVRSRMMGLLALVLALAALAAAWRFTALGALFGFDDLVRYAAWIDASPMAPLLVALVYVAGGLLMFPVTVLIAVTTLVFGPFQGALYALGGALLSAAVVYALGRALGRDMVRLLAGKNLNALSRRLARRGLLAMLLVRLVPIAPFSMINAVAGASHIGWRDFLLGTALGLTPGIIMTAAFVDRAIAAVRYPGPPTFALLAIVVLVFSGVAWILRRRLARDATVPAPAEDSRPELRVR
ncbi:MAG: VTT domain-containing protein [Casimicrobiaceae bacterium]